LCAGPGDPRPLPCAHGRPLGICRQAAGRRQGQRRPPAGTRRRARPLRFFRLRPAGGRPAVSYLCRMIYRLHREGGRYVIFAFLFFLAAALALVASFSVWTILLAALATALLTLFLIFFRNPPRAHGVLDPEAVIAPADGKVVVI